MTEKIRTRVFEHGSDKESTWPSDFGSGGSGSYYWDSETQTFKKGYPPVKYKTYGKAPYVIQDSIEPYYHPAGEAVVDSRAKLREMDKVCGTITTDKRLAPDPSRQRRQREERRKDGRESLDKAVALIDSGNAPLTEETRALCERQNEIVSKALNFDAFNVAGRKSNGKGKKYRRK